MTKIQAALKRFCWGKQFVFLLLLCVAMPSLSIPEIKFHHRFCYLHRYSMLQWYYSFVEAGKLMERSLYKPPKTSHPRLCLPRIMHVFDNISIVTISCHWYREYICNLNAIIQQRNDVYNKIVKKCNKYNGINSICDDSEIFASSFEY